MNSLKNFIVRVLARHQEKKIDKQFEAFLFDKNFLKERPNLDLSELQSKGTAGLEQLKSLRNLSSISNLKDLSSLPSKEATHSMRSFLSNYTASLSALVEGQREVSGDREFRLEDGETVGEKMDRFEGRVREVYGAVGKAGGKTGFKGNN